MEMTAYLALKIFLSLILTYCFFDQFYSIRHFLLKLIVKNSIFLKKILFIYFFRQRGRQGERQKETSMCF